MFNSSRIFEVLEAIISPSTSDQVLEVKIENYLGLTTVNICDNLVLYVKEENAVSYDVIFQLTVDESTTKSFSIYRSSDVEAAMNFIEQCKDKLLLLIEFIPNNDVSKSVLQNLIQIILEKPTWTVAHIAAHFGYKDALKNKTIESKINMTCSETLKTPLHVAVKSMRLNFVKALLEFGVLLDNKDVSGDTVFHHAAKTSREIIQALSKVPGADTVYNEFNNDGYTPYHVACMACRVDCVMEFLNIGVNVNLTPRKSPKRTACCINDNCSLRNLKIDSYRSYMLEMDVSKGGTPLHWSKSSELTGLLIENGCNMSIANFQGDSALHVMVRRNQISCVTMLLSNQADSSIQNADGDTPIHLAVKSGNLPMVQAFIAFNANIDIFNNEGESPLHIAATEKLCANGEILYVLHMVGAKRCTSSMITCNEGCVNKGDYCGIPPSACAIFKRSNFAFEEVLQSSVDGVLVRSGSSSTNQSLQAGDYKSQCSVDGVLVHSGSSSTNQSLQAGDYKSQCRVLCLDGGGIKGLVLIQMLEEIENFFGKPVTHLFDFIAGTSTGGILALLLASGKSVKECRNLYFRLKEKVFVGSRPYDASLLESFLKDELGETTVMSDIKAPKLMITAIHGDRKPSGLYIFRNYESPLEILQHVEIDPLTKKPFPSSKQQFIWKAARATGAAPTYFCASDSYIDGGLISNNPTLDALTEIHQCNQAYIMMNQGHKVCPVKVVVSLGTGKPPLIPVRTIDVAYPHGIIGTCMLAFGVGDLVTLLVDQVTHTDGHVVARAQALCDMSNIPYFRFSPQLSEDVALDETDSGVLSKILWETTAYMRNIHDELDKLTVLL